MEWEGELFKRGREIERREETNGNTGLEEDMRNGAVEGEKERGDAREERKDGKGNSGGRGKAKWSGVEKGPVHGVRLCRGAWRRQLPWP